MVELPPVDSRGLYNMMAMYGGFGGESIHHYCKMSGTKETAAHPNWVGPVQSIGQEVASGGGETATILGAGAAAAASVSVSVIDRHTRAFGQFVLVTGFRKGIT
jgi:hypothetical protein